MIDRSSRIYVAFDCSEAVCAREAGWPAALWLVCAAVRAAVWGRPAFRAGGDTTLVNAAWNGGGEGAIVVDVPLPARI